MEKSLFIEIPCGDQKVYARTMASWTNTCVALSQHGWHRIFLHLTLGVSIITYARNSALATFWNMPEFNYYLTIDSDLAWEPEKVPDFVGRPVDFVMGAYPAKCTPERYMVNFDLSKEHVWAVDPLTGRPSDNGLISINEGPGGFVRLTRGAVGKLIKAYPDLEYHDDAILPGRKAWAFWDCAIFQDAPHHRSYKGEDIMFCKRWRALGETVWLDPNMNFTHIGSREHDGNIGVWLKNRPDAGTAPSKVSAAA